MHELRGELRGIPLPKVQHLDVPQQTALPLRSMRFLPCGRPGQLPSLCEMLHVYLLNRVRDSQLHDGQVQE